MTKIQKIKILKKNTKEKMLKINSKRTKESKKHKTSSWGIS